MSKDETFIDRWSRRKGDARTRRGGAAPVIEDKAAVEVAVESPGELEAEQAIAEPARRPDLPAESSEEPVDLAELPDIETLDETSDYSAFMRAGVPDELRTSALRKLWRAKAFFGYRDGMNEYDDDYTKVVLGAKGYFESAYKAGRGYLTDEERPDYVPPEEEIADGEDEDATVAGDSSDKDNQAIASADPADDVPDDTVVEVEDSEIDIGDAESDIDTV